MVMKWRRGGDQDGLVNEFAAQARLDLLLHACYFITTGMQYQRWGKKSTRRRQERARELHAIIFISHRSSIHPLRVVGSKQINNLSLICTPCCYLHTNSTHRVNQQHPCFISDPFFSDHHFDHHSSSKEDWDWRKKKPWVNLFFLVQGKRWKKIVPKNLLKRLA